MNEQRTWKEILAEGLASALPILAILGGLALLARACSF